MDTITFNGPVRHERRECQDSAPSYPYYSLGTAPREELLWIALERNIMSVRSGAKEVLGILGLIRLMTPNT